MTFHCDWQKGQLKTCQSAEPLLVDVVQEAMGPAVSTLVEETDKRLDSLEGETNKRFEALEHEIQNLYNNIKYIQDPVMARGIEALKEWTGMERATVVYDSTVDEFDGDALFNKVMGRPNVAVIGFTTDGDVFGGFFSVPVTEQGRGFYDLGVFAFSFESHGRCETPQRFELKESEKGLASLVVGKNDNCLNGFVSFGVFMTGGFYLGNLCSNSWCWDMSRAFEGLENTTLSGKTFHAWKEGPYHHCCRIVAIQLE